MKKRTCEVPTADVVVALALLTSKAVHHLT